MNSNGRTLPSIGPSDSSDSGSDLIGATADSDEPSEISEEFSDTLDGAGLDANTDRSGTGERMSSGIEEVHDAADIGFDRVVSASEAGLGGGLDQAEEAILGITDEEIAALANRK